MPPRRERQLRRTAVDMLARATYLVGERRYDEVEMALRNLGETLTLAEQAFLREEDERFRRERERVLRRLDRQAQERKPVPPSESEGIPF